MSEPSGAAAFTNDDFASLSALVLATWELASDRDWSVRAGTLEWSCLATADHAIDCVFSYALFLASGRQDAYPNFGELHALPGATPSDMLDGLRAVTTMLSAVIATADPGTRAVIWQRPHAETGSPQDFAARGALELVLHAHDVAAGLGVEFDPPWALCSRLLHHTRDWPNQPTMPPSSDPWADLLERSGRPRP